MIVTFFGHGDFIYCQEDEQRALALLEEYVGNTPCDFYLGEYGGFDRFAYHCAKRFKRKHPMVQLIFVTPYPLDSECKEKNQDLIARFDLVLYPPLENVPPRYAISHRNRWMVDQASLVITYVCHRWGGAYTAYRYALQRKKDVCNLACYKMPI